MTMIPLITHLKKSDEEGHKNNLTKCKSPWSKRQDVAVARCYCLRVNTLSLLLLRRRRPPPLFLSLSTAEERSHRIKFSFAFLKIVFFFLSLQYKSIESKKIISGDLIRMSNELLTIDPVDLQFACKLPLLYILDLFTSILV